MRDCFFVRDLSFKKLEDLRDQETDCTLYRKVSPVLVDVSYNTRGTVRRASSPF